MTLKEPSTVDAAYQGRPGAYSEAAARAFVGESATLLACETLEDTFAALAGGTAAHAVVPVENTLAGSVTKAYDLLLEHEVVAVGEHVLRIDHALIGRPQASVATLRRVLSHPVALAQCEQFFRRHQHIEPVPAFDTAGAVPLALADGGGTSAAIASAAAARLYGGEVLCERIQDHAENFTRFLLLRRSPGEVMPVAAGKTIVTLRLANTPGALWNALAPFAREGLNLTKIESRPVAGRRFEYAFILEFEHLQDDGRAAAALAAVRAKAGALRVVGTFPRKGVDDSGRA